MKNIILIPARMEATRFPNKPLADIAGLPMIVRVMQQAQKAECGDVWVAAGNTEIVDVVKQHGGNAILTDNDLPSGTDRIYQALQRIGGDYDTVLNVQGDIPTVNPKVIKSVMQALENGMADITTACAKITQSDEIDNPNVVKAYANVDTGGFENSSVSVATAFLRDAVGNAPFYHHIGLYGYRKSSLEAFVSLPPSENEIKHKLEQLRAMDAGMQIDICLVDDVPLGVDTPADLESAIVAVQNNTI